MKRKKIIVWALALGLAITPNMVMAAESEENSYQVSLEADMLDLVTDDANVNEDITEEESMQTEDAEAVEEDWEEETEVDESCEGDREAEEDICEEEDTEEDWDGTYIGDDEVLPPTGCWASEAGWGEEMCGMEVPELGEDEADDAAEDGEGTAENGAEQQADNGTSGAESAAQKADYAESRDNAIAGVYQAANGTQLCASAGAEDTSLLELDENTKIYCYGYYTGVDGKEWYYVQCSQDGNVFTGFCSSENLK